MVGVLVVAATSLFASSHCLGVVLIGKVRPFVAFNLGIALDETLTTARSLASCDLLHRSPLFLVKTVGFRLNHSPYIALTCFVIGSLSFNDDAVHAIGWYSIW